MISIRKNELTKVLTIAVLIGSLIGSAFTMVYLEYKIRRDGGKIISKVLVEERETIIRIIGEELEKEINRTIENKKEELTREIQESIEQILRDKRDELGKEMERAIDDYIKMKIRGIFN